MSNLDTAPLEEWMESIIDYRGKTPEKTSSGIPLITAKVIKSGRIETPNEFIAEEAYDDWMRRGIPEAGDVVITTEAPLGEIAQLPKGKVALAQRVITLRGKRHRVDNTYLKYLLLSDSFQDDLQARATGTTVVGIKQSVLRKIELTFPDLGIQKAIAHILGTLDDKIELNRKTNETLEAIAKAIFKSWFVDFDPVRAKAEGRPTRLPKEISDLFPDSLENSELGEVPRGWKWSKLGDCLAEIQTGSRPNGGISGITHGVPSVGAESIIGIGIFDYTKTRYVTEEFFGNMRQGIVRSGDVLLYKDGGRPGMFEPHVTMVGENFPFGIFSINEHVYRLRLQNDQWQSYLYFLLGSQGLMEEMRNRGTGVAIPGLNSTQVRSLPFLMPGDDILNAFGEFANPLCARILRSSLESLRLSNIRDTLLPKLISGELRVPDAEAFVAEAGL